MPAAALTLDAPARADVVRELQERIRGMQRSRLDSRALPTHPALAGLLPGGALEAGGAYAVEGSLALALGLLQGPSAAGSWCAAVGVADLGVEAAAELGIDLDRLAIVPHPGDRWLPVVSALIDVVTVVLAAPPPGARVGEQAASRLGARLRQREAALVVLGEWPGAQARLRIARSEWTGLEAGAGHLRGRRAAVVAEHRDGRRREERLWLPDPEGGIAA